MGWELAFGALPRTEGRDRWQTSALLFAGPGRHQATLIVVFSQSFGQKNRQWFGTWAFFVVLKVESGREESRGDGAWRKYSFISFLSLRDLRSREERCNRSELQ